MITGEPLPPVEDADIAPPTKAEISELSVRWDATVPAYYKTMLDAGKPKSRFVPGLLPGTFIHRKTGRVINRKEVTKVFLLFSKNMKVR